MKVDSNASKTCLIKESKSEARGLIEEMGIHILLEVTLVGIIDGVLNSTVLSMLVGISIVEGCQFLWRKWREYK